MLQTNQEPSSFLQTSGNVISSQLLISLVYAFSYCVCMSLYRYICLYLHLQKIKGNVTNTQKLTYFHNCKEQVG